MYGYAGSILFIDLSDAEVRAIPTAQYSDCYLGGRGAASKIYQERMTPETNAFHPQNPLIFMTGPLVATGVQAAAVMTIVSKSPMTVPEGFCYSNLGGFFPVYLKRAGFDGIVIEGCAPKPVYVWITENGAEIRDASFLWGENVYSTMEILERRHGEKAHFLATGRAGENLVRTATIVASHHSTASSGFGSVMGAKNLKAIAVMGTKRFPVANPERLTELNKYVLNISKRLRLSIPPKVASTGYAHLLKVIGKGGCYQCGIECTRGLYRYGNRLEGYRNCESLAFYLPWVYGQKREALETFFDAPTLANDYSIDTWELEKITNWLYTCYREGILTEKDTELPLSRIGTREFLEKLLSVISRREGFGDILAEGFVRAVEKMSDGARLILPYNMTPTGVDDMFPIRLFVVHALLYPMEPNVHHRVFHETALVYIVWSHNQLKPGSTPVTTKVFRRIAATFWGGREAAELLRYSGKALAAVKIQNRAYVRDSLGLCGLAYPIIYSFNTPDHVGDHEIEGKLYNAVTGATKEELDLYAERMATLQRLIMLREGRKTPQDDFPPEYNFSCPLEKVPYLEILSTPGRGKKPVDIRGVTLKKTRFTKMLKEYYRMRKWDEETGCPLPETVKTQ